MKVRIKKSPIADTRTCDWSKVTKDALWKASLVHISDVKKGMAFLGSLLRQAGQAHDWTKIRNISQFHADFQTGFEKTDWWKMHQKTERHHFNTPEFVHEDVNLIDVLEQIVDGVMAGLARSGQYRCEPVSSELLQKAYANTAKLLIENVMVEEPPILPGYDRGRSDCYQDRCENIPLNSIGPDRKSIPDYIPEDQREGWAQGYRAMAVELYGEDWEAAEFSWIPVMEFHREEK